MKSLKRLKIVQGSLKSLDGIENLKNLETLHIHSLMKQLRQLNLTEATSVEFTKNLPNLIFCRCDKIHDKNREPESIIEQRYKKIKKEGQSLPGFTPLIDPFE